VIDLQRNKDGLLSYTLAVRSLDGSGPQKRGIQIKAPRPTIKSKQIVEKGLLRIPFLIRNTGIPAMVEPALHPSDVTGDINQDLYRLNISVEGEGWQAKLPNELVAVPFGQEKEITVFILPQENCSKQVVLVLRATSESQPEVSAESRVNLKL